MKETNLIVGVQTVIKSFAIHSLLLSFPSSVCPVVYKSAGYKQFIQRSVETVCGQVGPQEELHWWTGLLPYIFFTICDQTLGKQSKSHISQNQTITTNG